MISSPRFTFTRHLHVLAIWVALASSVAVSGCSTSSEADDAAAVDPRLVDILVDLHLADARGVADTNLVLADSLRDLVYLLHGLDSTGLAIRLDALSNRPGAVNALTEAVEDRLAEEQLGTLSP